MKFATMLLILCVLLAGCTSRPSLAGGTWTADVSGQTATLEFGRDGSMKMNLPLPIGSIGSTGTFSETENSLTMTIQRFDLPDLPVPGSDKLVERLVGRPVSFELEWTSPNEVKLSPQLASGPLNQAMTLKRKASP